MRPNEIIKTIYEYSEHTGRDEANCISVTQLISSSYRAKLALDGTERNESLIELKYKRSSTFGSGLHLWASRALESYPDVVSEEYMEIDFDGITITGTADMFFKHDDTWYVGDIKTGYGTKISNEQIEKWKLQLSIYRWMQQKRAIPDIDTEGYIFFISQSNNFESVIPIDLLSSEKVERYIREKLVSISSITYPDCKEGIKYDPCRYCDYICEWRNKI